MAIAIMFVVALAWCGWLLYDGIQECRKIDREKRVKRLADCLEVR